MQKCPILLVNVAISTQLLVYADTIDTFASRESITCFWCRDRN